MRRYTERVQHALMPLRAALRQHVRHAATHRLLALAREATARHEMLEGRRSVSLPADSMVAAR